MSIVDVAMVGRLGASALAATGMGSMMFWGALSVVLGVRTAVQTVASRRLGQGLEKDAGTALRNGLIMATLYSLPVSILGSCCAVRFVPFFIDDKIATPMTVDYSTIIFIGLFFSSYSFVFQGFFTGVEKTKVHMKVTITSNLLNVYLNAGLIYGTEGINSFFINEASRFSFLRHLWTWTEFPALGVKGAAIATLIASVWMTTHYSINLLPKNIRKRFLIFALVFDWGMMTRQIRLAAPQGLQESIIAIGWGMFYKIVGMIGLLELATTELLFTIMHTSFMPALGVGQACSTLVSKYMGQGRIEKAVYSIKESVRLSEYIMAPMGLSFILFPHHYLYIFTNDPEIINLGVSGLRIIGAIQFVDAIAFVLWFALSGAGNTVFPAVVESLLTWIVVVLGSYVFGVVFNMGFWVLWILFPVYMSIFASILIWKIKQGDWKKIKV